MSNESKNPIFWSVLAFAAGIALAAWGWDKNESTIPARTTGAIPMIVVGCSLIIGGLIGFFTLSGKK
jgi:TRAP-type C4-dicarboxylate transport system permease small subunit